MSEKHKKYLYINGKAVPVSEQVFRASRHHGRKEEYFIHDLKTEKFFCDQEAQTARFIPSREDSYERLLGAGHQFAAGGPTPEEEAISSLWLKDLMRSLSPEERGIIYHFYLLDKPEREACAALHLSQTTFRRRRDALLAKLRNLLKENF